MTQAPEMYVYVAADSLILDNTSNTNTKCFWDYRGVLSVANPFQGYDEYMALGVLRLVHCMDGYHEAVWGVRPTGWMRNVFTN